MSGQLIAPGTPKDPPYANSTVDERIAAAVRLIGYHEELRGGRSELPRSEWPGETFSTGLLGG